MKNYWKHFFIDNGDISIIEAGLQQNFPNQLNDYLVKHDYVIHIILSGKGFFKVNHQTYYLEANDCFILKKNQEVYYESDSTEPWFFGWIGLGGNHIHQYFQNTKIATEDMFHFKQNSQVFTRILRLITALNNLSEDSRSQTIKILGDVYYLLSDIAEELYVTNAQVTIIDSPQAQMAHQIYQYITNHYTTELTVGTLANHFDISRNYLFQICKQHFHQSPKQLILEAQMIRAAQLLQGTVLKVNEIADMVGYKDPFQFSKMFKQRFGHSPSQFRCLDENPVHNPHISNRINDV